MAHGSFTQPPIPQGHSQTPCVCVCGGGRQGGDTCAEAVQKQKMMVAFFSFFPVAAVAGIAATVNMRLNKET